MALRLASFLKAGTKQSYELVANSMLTNDLYQCQLCYLGEKHHSETVLESQLQVLHSFKAWNKTRHTPSKIAIIFEHFNMNQQLSLNKYHTSNDNEFSLKELQIEYDVTGDEGFHIENHYGKILKFARQNSSLFDVYGGFPPRSMAKLFVKKDINDIDKSTWNQLWRLLQIEQKNKYKQIQEEKNEDNDETKDVELRQLLRNMIVNGDQNHYQYFRYLLSNKVVPFNEMIKNEKTGLYDQYGSIFVAQCFKDTVMAYNIMKLWLTNEYDKIVIIAGHGHLDCGFGVSQRVEQLMKYNEIDASEINKLILSVQIKDEIVDTPWTDTVGDYILFIESEDK